MLQTVKEDLASQNPLTAHQMQVVVRIYADMQALAKAYKEMSILPSAAIFREFVRGFNAGDALCDYLDTGDEKGCSDDKMQGMCAIGFSLASTVRLHLKAMFRHGLLDTHCNHLLLGCTANNGCVRLLDPFVAHEVIRRQITILEGPSSTQEMAHVKNSFHSVQFRSVFRTQGLDDIRQKPSILPSPPHKPPSDYAATDTRKSDSKAPGPPSLPGLSGLVTPRPVRVGQNQQGQRVDLPLRYSSKEFAELKSRKLCNSFYLQGRCSSMESSGKCQHDHAAELSKKQMVVLQAFARQLPCRLGLDCKDSSCISGHRCTRENCFREKCWFPSDMHDVDTKVVTTT